MTFCLTPWSAIEKKNADSDLNTSFLRKLFYTLIKELLREDKLLSNFPFNVSRGLPRQGCLNLKLKVI